MGRKHTGLLLSAAFLGLASAIVPTVSSAQSTAVDQQISLSIPPQSLSGALRQLAEVSGLQLVYATEITDSKQSPGVTGNLTVRSALTQLLAGSGLTFQFSGDRTVLITATQAATDDSGVRQGGQVTVEGQGGNMPYGGLVSSVNGVNGSSDVEATEGTGSYTTGATSVASKIPLKPRETPNSVSVVTAQQMQDQSLNSVKDVLERLPGISSAPGANGEEFDVYSRGFKVDTYSFDGGAPVSYAYGNRPVIDMSEFDSVQLVRGADGLFGGYGNPGGVVNLVRKKPLDHRQITYGQDIGSYNYFREELDITGPLTPKLRGRFVVAQQDNEYFYDVANSHKTSVYGTLEYDLTPKTQLSVGASYTREKNRPNQGGLPRYLDGSEIDWPMSTCLCAASNFDRAKKSEFTVALNHQFTENLALKVNATHVDQNVDATYYGLSSSVVKGGDNKGTLGGFGSYNPTKQDALDFNLNGGFDLFNRHHQFVVGGNYIYANNDGGTTTTYDSVDVPDIFHFDPYAYPAPAYTPPFYMGIRSRTEQYGAYASGRFEITEALHLMLGVRYNYSRMELTSKYSFSPDPQVSSPIVARNLSEPAVGFTYDFLKNFTLYGSHQKTYRPQTYTQYIPGNAPPPPITGKNDEVGVKYEAPSQKFNASLSYYSIIQNGFLQTDYINGGNIPALQDSVSRGVDAEATGELFPGIQIAASYTYNDNKVTTQAYPSGTLTEQRTSFAPKNKARIWATYRPPASSDFNRFLIGGGIDYQSSAYNTGYICATPLTNPTDYCPYTGPDSYVAYEFTTKAYTTLSASVGYRLTNNLELSVVGKNLTDVKAWAPGPFQSVLGYNFYAPPFNVLVSLRARW